VSSLLLVADLEGFVLTDLSSGNSTSRFPVSTDGSSLSSDVVSLDVFELVVSSGDDLLHLSTFGGSLDLTNSSSDSLA
jgi:hypothetical protein